MSLQTGSSAPSEDFRRWPSLFRFGGYLFAFLLGRTRKGSYLTQIGSYLISFRTYLTKLGKRQLWFLLYQTQIGSYLIRLGSYLFAFHAYLFSSALDRATSDKDGFPFQSYLWLLFGEGSLLRRVRLHVSFLNLL